MKTIVKATEPRQFLSVVPHLLGFTPTRSAVIIPFSGGRSVGGMRVDLPRESEIDTFAATLIGMVCRIADADAYALVVYGEERMSAGAVPYATLAAALAARAHACGLGTVDALYVGGGRWASYLVADLGGDAADLDDGPAAGVVADPVGDQATGAALPAVDLATTERTAVALRELGHAVRLLAGSPSAEGARVHPLAVAATGVLDDLPGFFDDVVAERAVSAGAPADTAR
ncbi:DUF4192 family protein [Microbacterium sp. SORGH_AS_0888]|uniref:DUF4192 family protein n=1 Tax=Microbacterium sp. SORGH_AS_0888 TaxID=3041791 RepID=UPI00278251BB|nr:DUF4192 family protein [Microbacterium sp. SORGH_AS_0888]MDQ1130200.1 hypothetical protein [Microbacterium sp. SORGH_AS_0888]